MFSSHAAIIPMAGFIPTRTKSIALLSSIVMRWDNTSLTSCELIFLPYTLRFFTDYHFPLFKVCTFTFLSMPVSSHVCCKAKGLQMESTSKNMTKRLLHYEKDFLLLQLAFPFTVTHPFTVLCTVDKVQTTLWIIHSRVTCNADNY